MLDFAKIGARIAEERKFIKHVSQERMAEDLGMYQADISNLEHARSGSGITDLSRLELIADYFDIPLNNLLFGTSAEAHMVQYFGSKMELKQARGKYQFKSPKHIKIMDNLIGGSSKKALVRAYTCGPYAIYALQEMQYYMGNNTGAGIAKWHLYTFFEDELVANLMCYTSMLKDYLDPQSVHHLGQLIPPDVIDVKDIEHKINPYPILYEFPESDEAEVDGLVNKRLSDLFKHYFDSVLLVGNAYVMQDCRQKGMLRMMIDVLRDMADEGIIWLNLEPTSGDEMIDGPDYFSCYTTADIGQFNINAAIAEKLGFTIDERLWDRNTEVIDEKGERAIKQVKVRKCAYYIPAELREILSPKDEQDRILEETMNHAYTSGISDPNPVDVYSGEWKEHGFIIALKANTEDGTVFAFARGKTWNTRWLGVSYENPAPTGREVSTFERYSSLEEATSSKYYKHLKLAEYLLGSIYFGTVDPGDFEMEI